MRLIDFRHPHDENLFAEIPYRAYPNQNIFNDITGKTAIIFIPGYNNTRAEHIQTANHIDFLMGAHSEQNHRFFAVTWPSNGKVIEYYKDRRDARSEKAGERIYKLCEELKYNKIAKISFLTHSMGAKVFIEALIDNLPSNWVHRWVALAPDLSRIRCCKNGRYGEVASKLDRAMFLYSKWDRVLNIVAPLAIPTARVGAKGLPMKVWRPDNWYEINASKKYGAKFRHHTYLSHPDVIWEARRWLCGNGNWGE